MLVSILLLVLGFVLLIKGADIFVDGAASMASHLKVSKILIGLTIIAFGTSAPELAVSINALASHNSDIVLGNVFGSNIMNIVLILGVAAIIHPIKFKYNTTKKELPMCLLISTLLVILFLDTTFNGAAINEITRSDAFVILLFFSIFVYYLISLSRQGVEEEEKPKFGIVKSIIFVLLGLAGIVLGSDLVVDHASNLATLLGVSERVISLTIVAFGTSLPELVTTIVSSRKGEQDLLLGNIIGSNIFNICIVLGIPVAIFGTIIPSSFNYIDLVGLIGTALLLFIFAETSKKISKLEGTIMLGCFIVYYFLVFVI